MSADVLIASYLRIAKEDLAGASQLAGTGEQTTTAVGVGAAQRPDRGKLQSWRPPRERSLTTSCRA